jgi:DMSO/TMAO reductase YedYZ molybdopterin-dependent catalytic subunit
MTDPAGQDGAVNERPVTAAVAGAVSAGMALGAAELVTGISGDGPSLVSAVGTEFIERFAGSLKDLAVSLFGTNDKAALVVGIVVTAVALGAAFGVAAARRFWVGAAGFVAFGAFGFWAYQRDPLGSTGTGFTAAVVAVLAGVASLFILLHATAPSPAVATSDAPEPMPIPTVAGAAPRRAFLVTAATLGAGAVATAAIGRRLRGSGRAEVARREVALPSPATVQPVPAAQSFDVSGLSPYITPNPDFYRIDTALTLPQVDVSSWRLDLKGLVDQPFSLTFDELLAMDSVEETVTLSCVSNEIGGDLVGNAVWQGVPLDVLLDRAGVHDDATQIVGRSVDRFTAGFPTAVARDGRVALVAYAMNGEPLPVSHGFPARLVVAGLYGYVSATKWLREIELTTWDDFDGYWITRGWAKEGPIKTMSRIDVPRSSASLTPGRTPIAGVAWAPDRGISGVEVQVDDMPWAACQLGDVVSENTWVQWLYEWDATPGDHLIRVRATDADGNPQTSEERRPAPDGATGWHTRKVRVETST